MKYRVRIGESEHEVEVTSRGAGRFQVTAAGRTYDIILQKSGETEYSLQLEGETVNFYAQGPPTALELLLGGELFPVEVSSGGSASAAGVTSGPLSVKAVMPGLVREVYVHPEDPVERGGRLLVLEAMKMNNEVRAPRAGVVQTVSVRAGQRVDKGDVMLVIA